VRIDPRQTGFVGKGSDYLQLIKFWPSQAPKKGVCGRAKVFGSVLLQLACSVCVSLSAFSSVSLNHDRTNGTGIQSSRLPVIHQVVGPSVHTAAVISDLPTYLPTQTPDLLSGPLLDRQWFPWLTNHHIEVFGSALLQLACSVCVSHCL